MRNSLSTALSLGVVLIAEPRDSWQTSVKSLILIIKTHNYKPVTVRAPTRKTTDGMGEGCKWKR